MTSQTDPAIMALRAVHHELVARAAAYSDDDLVRPSGAAQWSVAQVLSHLGSGAEIAAAGLAAAQSGSPAPERSFYESVWDRWNAMSPREQADGALAADSSLVEAYEGLDDGARQALRFPLAFLPEPVGLELVAAMRLNEQALHAWDVAVADDAAAALTPAAVPVLLAAYTGPLAFLTGFLGKASPIPAVIAVHTTGPEQDLTLRVGERVALDKGVPGTPDGTLTLAAEAFLRLLTGRLGAAHTPGDVAVTGPVDLAGLRAVFPGF